MPISKRHVIFGATANLYSQFVQLFVQVASVGLILPRAGINQFGEWLVLSSIVGYALMADVGVTAYGGARIAHALGVGDVKLATSLFIRVKSLVVPLVGGAAMTIAVALSFPLLQHQLAIEQILVRDPLLPLLLALHVWIYISMSVVDSAFKSDRQYALSEAIVDTTRLLEWGAFIALYCLSTDFTLAVSGLVIIRASAAIFQQRLAERRLSCFSSKWSFLRGQEVDGLVAQSAGNVAVAIYQALWTSLPLVFLGRFAGPSYSAQFSVYRTFARVPLQILNLVYAALAPEMSRAVAAEGSAYLIRLLRQSVVYGLFIGVALSSLTAAVAYFAIPVWTKASVIFNANSYLAVAAAMTISAVAHPFYYFFVSTGKAKAFGTWCAFNVALVCVLEWLFVRHGVVGISSALFVGEALNVAVGFALVHLLYKPEI